MVQDQVSFAAEILFCGKVSIEIKEEGSNSWTQLMRFRDLGSPPYSEEFCSTAVCGTCAEECRDDGALASIPWTTFLIDTSAWKGQQAQLRFVNTRCDSSCCGTWLGIDNVRTHAPFVTVEIDIKPGSYPNSINPRSKGVIPVALLTTDTFDALTIDGDTVRFGPAEAAIAHRSPHFEDVDADGDIDAVFHFKTQKSGIECGDTWASLTGQTTDGIFIEVEDTIRTVGCKGPPSWQYVGQQATEVWFGACTGTGTAMIECTEATRGWEVRIATGAEWKPDISQGWAQGYQVEVSGNFLSLWGQRHCGADRLENVTAYVYRCQ